LHFDWLEAYGQVSNKEIVAIQQDTYNPSFLLIADSSAIKNINIFTKEHRLIYGSNTPPQTSVDGSQAQARFTNIVELLQPVYSKLLVVQSTCVRIIYRKASDVYTYAGSCNAPGSKTGPLQEARFSYIASAVLISQTEMVVVEGGERNRMILISEYENSAKEISNINRGRELFVGPSYKYLYLFSENLLGKLDLQSGSPDFIPVGPMGWTDSQDGSFADAKYTVISSTLYYNGTLVAVDSNNNNLRIFDMNKEIVSTICAPSSPDVQEELVVQPSSISLCGIKKVNSVGFLPEHQLLVLGGIGDLVLFHVSTDFISKCFVKYHIDCVPIASSRFYKRWYELTGITLWLWFYSFDLFQNIG